MKADTGYRREKELCGGTPMLTLQRHPECYLGSTCFWRCWPLLHTMTDHLLVNHGPMHPKDSSSYQRRNSVHITSGVPQGSIVQDPSSSWFYIDDISLSERSQLFCMMITCHPTIPSVTVMTALQLSLISTCIQMECHSTSISASAWQLLGNKITLQSQLMLRIFTWLPCVLLLSDFSLIPRPRPAVFMQPKMAWTWESCRLIRFILMPHMQGVCM